MSKCHTSPDHDLIIGAKDALNEAIALLGEALKHGQCPLSSSDVRRAATLAAGATVLILGITRTVDW